MSTTTHAPLNPDLIERVEATPDTVITLVGGTKYVVAEGVDEIIEQVRYKPASASSMLRRNLLIYGVGGLIIPFVGIWAIDLIVQYIPGFGR